MTRRRRWGDRADRGGADAEERRAGRRRERELAQRWRARARGRRAGRGGAIFDGARAGIGVEVKGNARSAPPRRDGQTRNRLRRRTDGRTDGLSAPPGLLRNKISQIKHFRAYLVVRVSLRFGPKRTGQLRVVSRVSVTVGSARIFRQRS